MGEHLPAAGRDDAEREEGAGRGLTTRVADTLLSVVAVVPASLEAAQPSPQTRAEWLTRRAARAAASLSAGAALVPGPFGVLSLLPDLYGVWKVQAQLVSDLAALHGKTGSVTREQMLYCLFKHAASQLLRDVVVRSGERYLVRRLSSRVLERLAGKIGLRVGQRALGKMAARFVPLLGAGVVGGYAYYDTRQVAATAIALFSAETVVTDTGLPAR